MQSELIALSENKQVTQLIPYIKKASNKVMTRLYQENENKKMQQTNEVLSELFLKKATSFLHSIDYVGSYEELEQELLSDKLLR